MLSWVVEAARACPTLDELLVATDSPEVEALCRREGWRFVPTSPALASGSDRVHAVAEIHPAGIYVNIQADEPLLRPEHIAALIAPFESAAVQVSTLSVACTRENLLNPNAVKVVTAPDGRALYFSRAPVPYDRDGLGPAAPAQAAKHLGLYAYTRDALNRFHGLPPSPLESTEKLEQLRFLENGIPIHVARVMQDTVGVDTEADLRAVERILLERN